jgi:hypothetical protein
MIVLFVKEVDVNRWAYHVVLNKLGIKIRQDYADSKQAAMAEAQKYARFYLVSQLKMLVPIADAAADEIGLFQQALEGNWEGVKASLGLMSHKDVREFGGNMERLEYWVFEELAKRKTLTPTLSLEGRGSL